MTSAADKIRLSKALLRNSLDATDKLKSAKNGTIKKLDVKNEKPHQN